MIKKIVLASAVIVSLVITYNLIIQIIEATKSGERLTQAADMVYQLEMKNKSLKNKLSQVGSPEFVEEEVRNKLGLTKAGETLIVIPEEKLKSVLGSSSSAKPRLPNPLGWLRVFF